MEQNENFLSCDLTIVKEKIIQESGKGFVSWDKNRCDAVEVMYKRWMVCAEKHKEINFVPNRDIDIFWHFHILHTKKYMNDCESYFGHYIHHNPHLKETEEMMINRIKSKELFISEFGIEMGHEIDGANCFWEPDPDEKGDCSKCDDDVI
jgi:hypothetical protein